MPDIQFASIPRGRKVLWIATAGGHVAEAYQLDRLIEARADSLWITSDHPQTRSLLSGRRVEFVEFVGSRDLVPAARVGRHVARLLRQESFDLCLSTGAAIAGFAVPRAARRGVPAVYVESIARVDGPSLTGRIMRAAPRVRTLTQYDSYASRSWRYDGTILAGFRRAPSVPSRSGRRVLVTLGTREYRFDRAVDAVLRALRADDDVVWQLGATERTGLPGRVYGSMSYDQLAGEVSRADVVVTHAGAGSIMLAWEMGKLPVLAARAAARREAVDDHQLQLLEELVTRGLGVGLRFDEHNGDVFDLADASAVVAV